MPKRKKCYCNKYTDVYYVPIIIRTIDSGRKVSYSYVPATPPFVFVHIIILPSSHDDDFIEICNSELNNCAYSLYIYI